MQYTTPDALQQQVTLQEVLEYVAKKQLALFDSEVKAKMSFENVSQVAVALKELLTTVDMKVAGRRALIGPFDSEVSQYEILIEIDDNTRVPFITRTKKGIIEGTTPNLELLFLTQLNLNDIKVTQPLKALYHVLVKTENLLVSAVNEPLLGVLPIPSDVITQYLQHLNTEGMKMKLGGIEIIVKFQPGDSVMGTVDRLLVHYTFAAEVKKTVKNDFTSSMNTLNL